MERSWGRGRACNRHSQPRRFHRIPAGSGLIRVRALHCGTTLCIDGAKTLFRSEQGAD